MELEAITAKIYIAAAIIISILVTSIIGVALSIILSTRSDQHVKTHNLHRRRARRERSGRMHRRLCGKTADAENRTGLSGVPEGLQPVSYTHLTLGSGGASKPVETGCTVTINTGAVYGGLTSARGNKVPAAQLAPKKHTVSKIQINKGVREALLKEIVSWVAVSSLTRV